MTEIFTSNILNTVIQIQPSEFNDSIDDTILEKLKTKVEGKCDRNGYIKPGSIEVIKRSLGKILQGNFNGSCNFKISYKVDICQPVEGMIVKAIVKNINKMGLLCELHNIEPSPLSIILAKQHHLKSDIFEDTRIDNIIQVEIIGIKFNYNDTQIYCIGRLTEDGVTLEEKDYDNSDVSEEEMDLGADSSDDDSLSNNTKGGGNKDIISMVGGSVNLKNELDENELDENELDENELDLDLDFEGEVLDLAEFSKKDIEPLYLHENNEIPNKLSGEIFSKEVKVNSNYKPFIKKPSNKINYHIYLILSELFIDFYEKYGVKPKKVSLSSRNKYFKSIKNYMKINASSYELELNDNRTFIT